MCVPISWSCIEDNHDLFFGRGVFLDVGNVSGATSCTTMIGTSPDLSCFTFRPIALDTSNILKYKLSLWVFVDINNTKYNHLSSFYTTNEADLDNSEVVEK